MKSKEELSTMAYANLIELEHGGMKEEVKERLRIELDLLYKILDEDMEEEYWERIEKQIYND